MNWKYAGIAIVLLSAVLCPRAQADVYTDDLTKCLVSHASVADRVVLMKAMFGAITANPALQSISTVTERQRQTYNKEAAALYERLMLVDCRREAVSVLSYEGPQSINQSLRVLGKVAARSMLGDPHVVRELSSMRRFIDRGKMAALYKEAGVADPEAPGTTSAR